MIDLHTHTTASDGRCTPAELVSRASAAGVTVLSVTDHDTVAGCDRVSAACTDAGIAFVPGIEITSVHGGVDVHVLGYFIDAGSPGLAAFLTAQRLRRVERVRQIVDRLASFGIRLDAEAIVRPAVDDPRKSAGRPWIARAMVEGGHVSTVDAAFACWLSRGQPAYVPRPGASPEEVFGRIHEARGLASVAHPGLVGHDQWIEEFAAAGLDALEAYHTKHDPAVTAHYLAMAARLGLSVTGGSDYHGDDTHGSPVPGSVSLPRDAYDDLVRRRTDATIHRA